MLNTFLCFGKVNCILELERYLGQNNLCLDKATYFRQINLCLDIVNDV